MRGLASLAAEKEARTWNDGGRSWFSPNDVASVDAWSAFNLSAVWACQTLIADAIATLPVDVFRKKAGLREPVASPGWIETPNPENNRIDYETQRMFSLLGWGNVYSYLHREGGSSDPQAPVLERWVLNPSSVEVRRVVAYDERSELQYWLRGTQIPNENMQHIRGYVTPGYFLGMSVIANARRGLDMSVSAENAGANLYEQGMHQSGVLSVPQMPKEVSKEVTDRLRETVMERNGGAGNAGKPMVLTGGTTWQASMMTPSDAQYLETRRFQIDEICRWFRVPPHKIQHIVAHASQGGGMGIEQMDTEFSQDTLLSWVIRLEAADSLLIPRGQFLKYNLNAYVRADMATRYEAYSKARMGGWASADDVLALEDLPPLPDGKGKIYLQPANYIEAGTTPVVPIAQPPQGDPNA